MRTHQRAIVGLLTAATVLLLGASFAWACTQQAYISVNPKKGPAGAEVTVNGEQFMPTHEIAIRWGGRNGQELARVRGPEFHKKVTIPNSAEPDTHLIWAVDTQGDWTAKRAFTVTDPNGSPEGGASDGASGGEDSSNGEPGTSGDTSETTSGGDNTNDNTNEESHSSDSQQRSGSASGGSADTTGEPDASDQSEQQTSASASGGSADITGEPDTSDQSEQTPDSTSSGDATSDNPGSTGDAGSEGGGSAPSSKSQQPEPSSVDLSSPEEPVSNEPASQEPTPQEPTEDDRGPGRSASQEPSGPQPALSEAAPEPGTEATAPSQESPSAGQSDSSQPSQQAAEEPTTDGEEGTAGEERSESATETVQDATSPLAHPPARASTPSGNGTEFSLATASQDPWQGLDSSEGAGLTSGLDDSGGDDAALAGAGRQLAVAAGLLGAGLVLLTGGALVAVRRRGTPAKAPREAR